jgi:hypothetical protein
LRANIEMSDTSDFLTAWMFGLKFRCDVAATL